jgi:hypothetical protein
MMDWGRGIRDWAGWNTIRRWNGWRRYAPAAGSVAAHIVVGAAIVSVMAASTVRPRPAPPTPPPELQVTLVAETPRPQPRPAERPATRPPLAAPDSDSIPDRPRPAPRKEEKRKPEVAETPTVDSVFVPPSIFNDNVPLGLRNMASEDRCNPRKGLRPADCGPQWSEKVGPVQSWQLASADELKQHYGDIIGPCRFNVGCEPGEWISSIGTRSMAGSPMAGGAASLTGGAESQTGRLPPHPDHRDPGFGD